MIVSQLIEWYRTSDNVYPTTGGTKACVYMGDVCWFYWNLETQTWHPLNGWRKNVGYPKTAVDWWSELPVPPVPGLRPVLAPEYLRGRAQTKSFPF